MLNLRPQTSIERKMLVLETLLNTTDSVSKVSDNSVLAGIAGGISKIAGKAEKDVILALSQLFPDTAYGSQLDDVALNFGLSPRFTASGSSVYVRIVADPGTIYNQTLHTLLSSSGIGFIFEQPTVVVGPEGFTYAKVQSITTGSQTNVDPLTISKISPVPQGHQYVINEVAAFGGRDVETDEVFRIRIKEGANILSRGTIAMLEQKFMSINEKVLKCFYQGINSQGKVRIAIVTQNGQDLSQVELNDLLVNSATYFAFTEYKPWGTNFTGVELVNILWQPFDVSLRLDYDVTYQLDDIRREMQLRVTKYCDFRFFDPVKQKVEWDDLLMICKAVPGVKYIPDQFFFPRADITIDFHRLPRLRGFLIMDLNGNILQNLTGTLTPTYYPNNPDFSYQQTALNNI